jgi:beta-glucosidase-like glycosyl hydrolase
MLNYQNTKAAIAPIKGFTLEKEEIALFEKHKPLGYILFTRNFRDIAQLQELITSLKNITNQEKTLILIDQEGGRVARLKGPDFTVLEPAATYIGNTTSELETNITKLESDFYKVGSELKSMGINVNCAPVADLLYPEASNVIGDRSYGKDPNNVIALCNAADKGLAKAGVQSIMKHIPGHGRATKDSHHELPIISNSLEELMQTDFKVFKDLKIQMAMTAHIVFKEIDPELPVTLSKKCIDFIRNELGYKGLIITDALEMRAIKKDIAESVKLASNAGCDILLYCNPDIVELTTFLEHTQMVTEIVTDKIEKLCCFV